LVSHPKQVQHCQKRGFAVYCVAGKYAIRGCTKNVLPLYQKKFSCHREYFLWEEEYSQNDDLFLKKWLPS